MHQTLHSNGRATGHTLSAFLLVATLAVPGVAASQLPAIYFSPSNGSNQSSPMSVLVTACDASAPIDHANAAFTFNGSPISLGTGQPTGTGCTGWKWSVPITLTSGGNDLEAWICDTDDNCNSGGAGWNCTNCFSEHGSYANADAAGLASIGSWSTECSDFEGFPSMRASEPVESFLGGAYHQERGNALSSVARYSSSLLRSEAFFVNHGVGSD